MKTLIQKRKYITSNHFRSRLNVQIYSFFSFVFVYQRDQITRTSNEKKKKASKYRFKTKQKKTDRHGLTIEKENIKLYRIFCFC
jgi:hypothetical protein